MNTRYILMLAAMCGLSACKSPQAQLHDLLVRYPELVRTDTVAVDAVAYVLGDTLTAQVVYLPGDTVMVYNDRQVVQVVRMSTGSPCDTAALAMHLQAVVHADTVVVSTKVPCDSVQPTRVVKEAPMWIWALVMMLVASLLLSQWKR